MPKADLNAFWASITNELKAIEERVNNLIKSQHKPSSGLHREHILKNVIDRHLPEVYKTCTGFIFDGNRCSTQIDILVIDGQGFTYVKEGDLVIVPPSAVRAIIEVKPKLSLSTRSKKKEPQLLKALIKLAENKAIVEQRGDFEPRKLWTGLFRFTANKSKAKSVLEAISTTQIRTSETIDFVAWGNNTAILWNYASNEPGWFAFNEKNLAAGLFVTSLLGNITECLAYEDSKGLFYPILRDKVKPIATISLGESTAKDWSLKLDSGNVK